MTGIRVEATAEIVNKKGLHARASAKFVETVAKFQAEVSVSRGDNTVSGRSIMGLMMLGASQGATIQLTAEGPQAALVMQALLQLIAAKFNEDA